MQFQFRRRERRKIKKPAKCPHHNLKVVEVVGYRGRTNAVEHVMYLIENAVGLERIVIDPVQHWTHHHTGADRTKGTTKKEGKARDHGMHRLKSRVPSNIEFVCL